MWLQSKISKYFKAVILAYKNYNLEKSLGTLCVNSGILSHSAMLRTILIMPMLSTACLSVPTLVDGVKGEGRHESDGVILTLKKYKLVEDRQN